MLLQSTAAAFVHAMLLCFMDVPHPSYGFFFSFFIAGRHNRQRWLRRDNINVFAGFLGTLRLIVVDCLKKEKEEALVESGRESGDI